MYISRIVIKNFRNLKNIDVKIESGLTCLVGENNCGKTNFLEALRLALDANYPNYHRQLSKDDFSYGMDITQPQQILIGIQFTDFRADINESKKKEHALANEWTINEDLAQICYRFRPGLEARQKLEVEGEESNFLTIEDYEWELVGGSVPGQDGEPKDLAEIQWHHEFPNFVKFNRLSAYRLVFLPAIRDVEEDLRKQSASPLFKLLEATEIPDEKKENLIERVKAANEEIAKQEEIKNLASEIEKSFGSSVGDVFKMAVRLGMASPTFKGIARALTILLSDSIMTDFDPSRNGLGLNNILYISMLLKHFEFRTKKEDTAGQLLLVEEPEAHLHPQLQRILFSRLLRRDCQVIATSHSTHITSRGTLENLIVFTKDPLPSLTSSCRPSMIANIYPEDKSDLERYLDATKSTLLFSRKVILVEGMSEVFLIPPLVKKVINIDLEEHGISIVPIHGVHFDCYMKLFGPKGIRKKCVVITDGDLKPSDATESIDFNKEDFPRIKDLSKHENEFVKIFYCKTTFERHIAMPENLMMFAKAAKEIGATEISKSLKAMYNNRKNLTEVDKISASDKVLNTAKRFGKARFAQIVSKHCEHACDLPSYISEAVKWITE